MKEAIMKKYLFLALFSIMLLSPVFAIVSPSISFLSDDMILSQVLQQGKIDVIAKLQYWNPQEVYRGNTDYVMEPITKSHLSVTDWSIPVMVSYGITDKASARVTVQYIKRSMIYTDYSPFDYEGYGLGDSKLEFLYKLSDETADKCGIALNVGTDILTGRNYINSPKFTSDTSLDTGDYAPKYYFSAIFDKKYNECKGTAMVGIIGQPSDKYGTGSWIPANEFICSLMMSKSAGNGIEYGGELSGLFAGENIDDYAGASDDTQNRTPIQKISVSPFIKYQQSESVSYKGGIEIPLAMKGTTSGTSLGVYGYRGIGISLGVNVAL
jgi:hypothetical protein